VPAAGDQSAEYRLPGCLGVDVERLGVVLFGEGDDLLAGDLVGAELVDPADLDGLVGLVHGPDWVPGCKYASVTTTVGPGRRGYRKFSPGYVLRVPV